MLSQPLCSSGWRSSFSSLEWEAGASCTLLLPPGTQLPAGLMEWFGFTAFSLKHSRAHSIVAGFSPKQKPRGVSHRANPRRKCSLPQTFQLGSVRVSWSSVQLQAEMLQMATYLGSKNSSVPATLQNKSFPGR